MTGLVGVAGGENAGHSNPCPLAPKAGAPGTCDGESGVRGRRRSAPNAELRITCGDGGAVDAGEEGASMLMVESRGERAVASAGK